MQKRQISDLSFETKKKAVEFMHSKNLWYFEVMMQ